MINFGRFKIFTDYREINDDNIERVLLEAYPLFLSNCRDIEYLFNYFRGLQPILNRQKKVRPEINNKIVENHAYNIAKFRAGYLLEKPIQYVASKNLPNDTNVVTLNSFMEVADKESVDEEIANDRAICGLGYRLCLPNKKFADMGDDSPFEVSRINPMQAFIIYSSDIGNKPLVGVIILMEKVDDRVEIKLQAYTEDRFYIYNYSTMRIESVMPHPYGGIPLIEYPLNKERMGAFEPVLPMLDAINNIQSNRVDAIEQFIQAILVFKNIKIRQEMLDQLRDLGAISIADTGEIKANIEFLQQELNQEQVQKLINYIVETAYRICATPYAKGSASDSGTSTIFHDGWNEIEAQVRSDELMFKSSERKFLKLALGFTRTLTRGEVTLKLIDLQIKFTRRLYENTYQKIQGLDLLLRNEKIAPRLAFAVSGLFIDSEEAYKESLDWGRGHGAYKTTEELNNASKGE